MGATTTETAQIAAADCDVADTKIEAKPETIQLCMFPPPMTAPEWTTRTSQYAKDPVAYLKEHLGDATFRERETMLSIPDEITKDMYGTGTHKQDFEQHIAKVLGKQHGLFFLTGVQAQLAALKIHCERTGKKRVAWHVSSHLESAEERAFEHLYGLERILLGSEPEELPTVEEIKKVLDLPADERPTAVVIEVPNRVLGCKTYKFSELERISSACKEAGVILHMDGARLWEIEPYYQATAGKTFVDLAGLFDSVYVSFYKGLGGAAGAVLVHNDESFIAEAKVWQRRAGGNAVTLMYEIIDCERGYNENIATFERKRGKMMEIVDRVTEATRSFKTEDGASVVVFNPEKATCCQTHTIFQGFTAEQLMQARDAVQEKTGTRVFERLRPKKTVDEEMRADRAGKAADGQKTNGVAPEQVDDRRHFMEWMIMSVTEKIETQVFVDGYTALCKELSAVKGADS